MYEEAKERIKTLEAELKSAQKEIETLKPKKKPLSELLEKLAKDAKERLERDL